MFKITAILACLLVLEGIIQVSADLEACSNTVDRTQELAERATWGGVTLRELCNALQETADACRGYVREATLQRFLRAANGKCESNGQHIQSADGEDAEEPKKLAQRMKTAIKLDKHE